jgi:hypothetical protein
MTSGKKTKEYDNILQKYIDNKSFVKICRTIFENEVNLSGFILSISKDFLLIQVDNEFRLDGFAIIIKNDFDSIRHSSYERTQRKIFKAEGLLSEGFGLDNHIKLDSWTNIFSELKRKDIHIIIESDNKDYLDFHIGHITKITSKSVSIHNYNPNGIYDNKPTIIKFDKIRSLKFGDNYSTVFRKYLRTKIK